MFVECRLSPTREEVISLCQHSRPRFKLHLSNSSLGKEPWPQCMVSQSLSLHLSVGSGRREEQRHCQLFP